MNVSDAAYQAKEMTTVMAEEPKKLGSLVVIEILKSGISSKKCCHELSVRCARGTVLRHAGLGERARRKGKQVVQEEEPADDTLLLASTRPQHPKPPSQGKLNRSSKAKGSTKEEP